MSYYTKTLGRIELGFFGTEASFTYHTATWPIGITTGRAYQSLGLFIHHAGSATKRLKQKSDKITNYPS